jgi:hypothetical protein
VCVRVCLSVCPPLITFESISGFSSNLLHFQFAHEFSPSNDKSISPYIIVLTLCDFPENIFCPHISLPCTFDTNFTFHFTPNTHSSITTMISQAIAYCHLSPVCFNGENVHDIFCRQFFTYNFIYLFSFYV